MGKIRDLILGVERDPQAVALARSVVYLIVPGAIDLALAALAHTSDPRLLAVAPVAGLALRALEGVVDQRFKPSQNVSAAAPFVTPPAQVPTVPR